MQFSFSARVRKRSCGPAEVQNQLVTLAGLLHIYPKSDHDTEEVSGIKENSAAEEVLGRGRGNTGEAI